MAAKLFPNAEPAVRSVFSNLWGATKDSGKVIGGLAKDTLGTPNRRFGSAAAVGAPALATGSYLVGSAAAQTEADRKAIEAGKDRLISSMLNKQQQQAQAKEQAEAETEANAAAKTPATPAAGVVSQAGDWLGNKANQAATYVKDNPWTSAGIGAAGLGGAALLAYLLRGKKQKKEAAALSIRPTPVKPLPRTVETTGVVIKPSVPWKGIGIGAAGVAGGAAAGYGAKALTTPPPPPKPEPGVVDRVAGYVKDNPLASTGIGVAGLGGAALLGHLLTRRNPRKSDEE